METFNLSHSNNLGSSNYINAKLSHWHNDIMLSLSDSVNLHIPSEHQHKLANYIGSEIIFSIHPEFVSVADNNEFFNVVDAELIGCFEKNGHQYQEFNISGAKIICRAKTSVNESNVGQSFKLNFDTFFGHIYDRETEENLTI